jgi:hypothetical protein
MKRLFMIAALAASVAVQAQTISGALNFDATKTPQGTDLGVGDANINISATEKVGTLDVTAALGIEGAARGKTVQGGDATIKLSNDAFGAVTVGTVKLSNGLADNTFGMIPGIGSDGIVVGGSTVVNGMVRYETPKSFSPIAVSVMSVQPTAGGDYTQTYGAAFQAGALQAKVDYTDRTDRVRLSGQYDFGKFRIGAGVSALEKQVPNSFVVAVAAPITQALTVGGAFYNGDGKAYEVASSYALSKHTSVALAYRTVTDNSTASNNVSTTRARLQYVF